MTSLLYAISMTAFCGFLIRAAIDIRPSFQATYLPPDAVDSCKATQRVPVRRILGYCGFLWMLVSLAIFYQWRLDPQPAAFRLLLTGWYTHTIGIIYSFIFLWASVAITQPNSPGFFPGLSFQNTKDGQPDSESVSQTTPSFQRIKTFFFALGILTLMILFSSTWMHLASTYFHVRVHPDLGKLTRDNPEINQGTIYWSRLIAVFLAPFLEEITFRGYMQARLERWLRGRSKWAATFIPIFLPALLWALMHQGSLDPDWVKWVQIFGLGILLGWTRRNHSLGLCVLLHLAFNFHLWIPPLAKILTPSAFQH